MVESVVRGWFKTVWAVVVAVGFLVAGCSSGAETASSTTVDPADLPWVEEQRIPFGGTSDGASSTLAFADDGAELVVATKGETQVLVWDMETQTGSTFDGHKAPVTELALSNQRLAASTNKDEGFIWDIGSKEIIHELDVDWLFWPSGLEFSPDGSVLAIGGVDSDDDGEDVVVIDVETGERIHTLTGHERDVGDVFFSPDGTKIYSASQDRTVRVWDVASGEELSALPREDELPFAALSPDGSTLAVPDARNEVWLRDVETGDVIKKVQVNQRDAESGHILSLDFGPNGEMLAISSVSNAAVLNLETGENVQHFPAKSELGIGDATFNPDGDRLAIVDLREEDIVVYKRNPK